jgi:hypothetical protein
MVGCNFANDNGKVTKTARKVTKTDFSPALFSNLLFDSLLAHLSRWLSAFPGASRANLKAARRWK